MPEFFQSQSSFREIFWSNVTYLKPWVLMPVGRLGGLGGAERGVNRLPVITCGNDGLWKTLAGDVFPIILG